MPYVDPAFVAAALRPLLPATITLEPEDAEDEECEDGSVHLLVDGQRKCSVQVNPGYLGLNTYGYSTPGDSGSYWMRNHGVWGVQPADIQALAAAAIPLVSV